MMWPDLSTFHLLRPAWLWALLLLPVLVALWLLRRRRSTVWREVVDPHLLPHLLDDAGSRRRGWHGPGLLAGWLAGLLGYTLAVLALAGPSWRQVEQPLWQARTPLVIVLDLSDSMLAADPPPSRLAQARAKLADLLASREDGPVGLLVYADDAFTVAPITDDVGNVALFLDALAPDIMPGFGQGADAQHAGRAIGMAVKLMRQSGYEHGRILLMAGDVGDKADEAAAQARTEGYEVAVLGLGRRGGVAYRNTNGRTATARFDEAVLRRVAAAGGGNYARLAADGGDLDALGVRKADIADATESQSESGQAWLDEGFWLLPLLMLLALFAFRRGTALAVLLVCLWLPIAPAQAMDWWRRDDQVEHRRMDEAARAYRDGDYASAAEGYTGIDSADGYYNRGNALAKAGRYEQAIEAYDRALELQSGMEDAVANRAAVEAAMKQQQEQQEQDGDDSKEQSKGQDGEGEDQENRQQGDESPEQESSDTSNDKSESDGQPSETQDGQDKNSEDNGDDPPTEADSADDAEAQQAADEAQRERMQQALEQAKPDTDEDDEAATATEQETPAERERRLANEAWLRRVPDDPGGLLREKFRIEHERRRWQGGTGDRNR